MKFLSLKLILLISFLYPQNSKQIEQVKQFIKDSGMSNDKAKNIARSQGYTEKQIESAVKNAENQSLPSESTALDIIESSAQDLQARNSLDQNKNPEMIYKGSVLNENGEKSNSSEIKSDELIDPEDFQIESQNPNIRQFGLTPYFGYDIFNGDPALFQSTTLGAVDPNYTIGPGDEIIVMLWGETEFRQVFSVNREGFIFLPDVGQVFVNGLNLNLLESKLFKVLSQSFASLNNQGGKATTFLDVSLGNLRPLRIQVLGEVAQPGAYTVQPSTSIFSSLYYFNGPTNLGSLRDIRLIRNEEVIASIDFYDYLFTGKKFKDEKLQLDDVIFIPKRLNAVTINGEIIRPGIYELKKEESLNDLIKMSGGLKQTAYLDRAQIDRIVPFKDRDLIGMDRVVLDVDLNKTLYNGENFEIQDGDVISIFSILNNRQNVVHISGSITRPGFYELTDSLKLYDIILKADSLLGDAYLDRLDLNRTKPDFSQGIN